jgi:hypothetical protein
MLFATALWLGYGLAPRSRRAPGIRAGQRFAFLGGAAFIGALLLVWLLQSGGVTAEASWRLTSLFTGDINDASSAQRIWRAEYAWDLIQEHPWGSGLGYVDRTELGPHNTYLFIGIDYGLQGLLVYLAILFLGLGRAMLAGWKRGANATVLALLLIYSGMFTHYVAGTIFFAVGFAALATGALIRPAEEDAPVPGRSPAALAYRARGATSG